jgi:hypothetical protein
LTRPQSKDKEPTGPAFETHLHTYSGAIREDKTKSSSKTIKFTNMAKFTGEDENAYYFHLEHEPILNRPYCFLDIILQSKLNRRYEILKRLERHLTFA